MPSLLPSRADPVPAGRREVQLHAAAQSDLARVYQWLAESDLTREMMGPPLYIDRPVIDRARFEAENPPSVFEGGSPFDPRGWIIRAGDEDVGFLRQGRIDLLRDVVELDVWLAARRHRGHGFGSAAIDIACEMLQRDCGVNRFVLRPSLRNVHALRAMRRAGFRDLGIDPSQVAAKLALRAPDYADEVLLFRVLPLPPARLSRMPRHQYVFIDSEFTSLERPQLVSFGAAAEDDRVFYCEVAGWTHGSCSDFVIKTVLPLLDGTAVARSVGAAEFTTWLGELAADAAVVLVSDSGFDRWAVAELFASALLPPGVAWQRIPIAYAELDRVATRLNLRRHHALDDARALRDAILKPEH
jgi:diamine N-acetyltransferase